jgi:hypothetical protein
VAEFREEQKEDNATLRFIRTKIDIKVSQNCNGVSDIKRRYE